MPTYDFICDSCKHQQRVNLPVNERNNEQTCGNCGTIGLRRVFGVLPYTAYDFKGYVSTVTGEYIDSLAAHQAHKAKTGLVEVHDMSNYVMKYHGGKLKRDKREHKKEVVEAYKKQYKRLIG